jgi:hypothetical protein
MNFSRSLNRTPVLFARANDTIVSIRINETREASHLNISFESPASREDRSSLGALVREFDTIFMFDDRTAFVEVSTKDEVAFPRSRKLYPLQRVRTSRVA